jgi:type I restriction-modification system DNA methylase subunit
MGDEIQNFKLDIGRLTNIVHQDEETTVTDGGQKAQKLINKIYQDGFLPTDENGRFNIHMFPYDAVGEGFEKFMSDAGSTGGNWGQYFTSPQVIEWIINKCGAEKDHKIIDPFAGSGGFILQVKKLTKVKTGNILAHEQDDRIFKFLKFNANIAELELDNIEKGDSLDYSSYLKHNENKFDRIFSNPPFGLSFEILLGTVDMKTFWDIMKSGKYTIKDSMGLSLFAIYKMLKKGGTAGFVTERGVLNNGTENKSWEKRLRKHLLENCNIKEILLLPKGIFSHTKFDTACVIMEKGTPTKEVIFHQGYFKDEDKGKGDKKMYIKENVLTVSLKQIVNKDWSLKYDDYVEKKEETYNGIEYKSIVEICEIQKTKRKAGESTDNGKYNYYTSSPIIQKSNNNDFNGEYIIIGNGGAGSCHYINDKFSCSADNFILKNKINNINTKYIFYYTKLKFIELRRLFKGNGLKHLTLENLPKFKIPILPADLQERIVKYMDKTFGQDYKKLDKIVSKFKDYDLFKLLLNEDYSGFDDLLVLYEDIMGAEACYERYTTKYKNLLIKKCFEMVPGKEMKLGELVETSGGIKFKLSKQPITIPSKIAYLRGGDLNNYKTTEFNGVYFDYEDKKFNDFIINKGDIYYTLVGTVGICGEYLCDLKTIISGNLCRIYNCKINKKYLINYLIQNKPKTNNNAQPNISRGTLEKIIVKVPSVEDQEKVVKMIEQINKEESDFNNQVKSFKIIINNLYQCVEQLVNNSSTQVDEEQDDSDDEEQPVEPYEEEEEEEEEDEKTIRPKEKPQKVVPSKGKKTKSVDESEDDEPDEKTKPVKGKKVNVDESDDEPIERVKPAKVKKTKTVVESDEELVEKVKPIKGKKTKTVIESDDEEPVEKVKPVKVKKTKQVMESDDEEPQKKPLTTSVKKSKSKEIVL